MPAKKTVAPHENSPEVAHELVETNIALVDFCITTFFSYYLDNPDVKSLGYLGIVKASRRYNPAFGWKFSTYACTCIRREILDGLRTFSIIRVPDSALKLMRDKQDHWTVPFAQRATNVCSILEHAVGKFQNHRYYDDSECLDAALNKLPARNLEMLVQKFGLDGNDPMTMGKIGEAHGVTKQRVEQILRASYILIREHFRETNTAPPVEHDDSVKYTFHRSMQERVVATKQLDDGAYYKNVSEEVG